MYNRNNNSLHYVHNIYLPVHISQNSDYLYLVNVTMLQDSEGPSPMQTVGKETRNTKEKVARKLHATANGNNRI